MKHVISDKYSIAWFKLAQCIAKGERERAMGIYRLLSHSIDNSAYAKQLEADIYLYFQDSSSAIAKYKEAAALYSASGAYIQAMALYEQCLALNQNDLSTHQEIFAHARMIGDREKIVVQSIHLINELCKRGFLDQAEPVFFEVLDKQPSIEWIAHMTSKLLQTHALGASDDGRVAPIIDAIIDTLAGYEAYDLQRVLQQIENEVPRYRQIIQKHGDV